MSGTSVVADDATGPHDIFRKRLPELPFTPGDVVRFSEPVISILNNDFSRCEQLHHQTAEATAANSRLAIPRHSIEEYRMRLAVLRPSNET